ncbi:MAG: hypothetical protein HYW07_02375 [Candidatus Latescibacteria bacterium]|nr:hypothetical protein [Candidatus Latescibacterota bacterium]
MEEEFLTAVEALAEREGRYHKAGYLFIYDALQYTVEKMGKTALPKEQRHVSGRDLLQGISQYSLEQFGPLTRAVFAHWGIHHTGDFGRMVFSLVEAELMSKTPQDCPEDFAGVYDFAEEFDWKKRKAQFKRLPAS